ncbi:MAG: efflux RND transporter periplasmic adaptor subunit [Terriglobia bacterium]
MKALKWLLGVVLVVIAAAVLLRTFAQPHKDPPDQDDEDQAESVQTPSRVSVINGQTVVTLNEATQKRIGIVTQALRAIEARQQTTAAATILPAQDLVTLRSALIAAQAQVEKAQVSVDVSRKEYKRLKTLYQENQNASQKSVQAAEATLRMNRATLQAAQQELEVQKAAAIQSWGSAVAGWIAAGTGQLARVLNQQGLLVQVTAPPGNAFTAAQTVGLSTPEGRLIRASYVSTIPRVDPRIQGISLLYAVRSRPGLAPGLNLVAHLPVGRRLKGVLVAGTAIVWWQGQAWVYEQTAPTQFTRMLVPTDEPLRSGYFVTQGFAPGSKVVVRGAQDLLSEEFRSQIQPED